MTALDAAAWAGTVAVLATYLVLARTGRARPFHLANAAAAPLLAASAVTRGAMPSAAVSAFFGAVGLAGVMGAQAPEGPAPR